MSDDFSGVAPADPSTTQPSSAPASAGPPMFTPLPAPPSSGGDAGPGSAAPPPPARGRVGFGLLLVAALLGGMLGAGAVAGAFYAFPPAARSEKADTGAVGAGSGGSRILISTDTTAQPIEAVSAKVTPSVVYISIAQTAHDPWSGRTASQVVGNASGVVIRSDGYILTNSHVVEDASQLFVSLGGKDVTATVVGNDPKTDLAVIKVDRTGLQAADIGSSASLKVGETVVAVGSPFGLDHTVTSGIVSALNRSNISDLGAASYTNMIQTDAAINPGNSGGALVDMGGRVVGINAYIQTGGADQSAGIGFAIPIDFAMNIAEQLIASGKAEHPYMGLSMATVDQNAASQLGQGDLRGVLLQSVLSGSPAEKAGLKQGDVITAIGGDTIANVEDAFAAIRSRRIGQVVDVTLVRDGKTLTVKVTLGSDVGR